VQYYIETKTQPGADRVMETRLVELLDRLDVIPEFLGPLGSSPVIIQSFDAESLRTIGELAPELPTALLLSVPTPAIDAGTLPDVDVLAPNAAVLAARPELVAAAHAEGREVHTWTVDDPAQMGALVDNGVDGFFTNDPATARAVVDQAGRGSGREPIEVTDTDVASEVDACPAGMGVGLSAADLGASPPAPEVESDDGELVLWPLAVGAGVLVAAMIGARLVRGRKVGT
jgi:glycerophosphoryl diester phosphodiesterase